MAILLCLVASFLALRRNSQFSGVLFFKYLSNELFTDGFLGTSTMVAFTTGQGSKRYFSFGATRITSQRIYAVKKQLPDTSLKEKTTIHPIFLSQQKLTDDPMCVTESHWLKNQQCIVYRFQSGLCPCTAFPWTWRWTCGATSTACENLTYKVKSRRFKSHDSITSRSISQMLADLSRVEFKIIVSKIRKRWRKLLSCVLAPCP